MMTRVIFTAVTIFIGFTALAQSKNTDTLVVQTSAKCGMCKTRLENDLKFEKGVRTVSLDNASKKLTVIYNSSQTNPDKIRTAVTKIGYDADSMEADSKAHARLPKCCQKTAQPH